MSQAQRIEEIEWEACFVEPRRDRELERELRRRYGNPPPGVSYFTACPWLARALAHLDLEKRRLLRLSHRLAEEIQLVVSQDNSCRYCFAASRLLLRLAGVPESRVRRLEQELLVDDLPPEERQLLDLARRISRASPPVTRADLDKLVELGVAWDALRETVLLAAIAAAFNRIATLLALPPTFFERLPDRWPIRLTRPLLGRFVARRFRSGQPVALPAELVSAPFGGLVAPFNGLSLARGATEVIDDAWRSPLLPPRTKALIFAVVARGLGCVGSEREALRLLAAEGVPETEVNPVLDHLDTSRLDEVERLAVPFARETIRYRPAPIQRRARAVREKMDEPQFLELVGIVALANTVCRLAAVSDTKG